MVSTPAVLWVTEKSPLTSLTLFPRAGPKDKEHAPPGAVGEAATCQALEGPLPSSLAHSRCLIKHAARPPFPSPLPQPPFQLELEESVSITR